MHRVTTDESPLRLEVLRQVALRDLSPTRRWHLRIPEEEHSLHWFRQRGRTLQLQSWTREHDQWLASHGRSRADIRRQIEQRTQRARAALERLKEADRNASGRCQRCDLVRAQAWGLGHANWASRRCGRCWARHAEQLSLERHFGDPRAALMQQACSTGRGASAATERLPGLLLRALQASQRQQALGEGLVDAVAAAALAAGGGSPHPLTRSARVTLQDDVAAPRRQGLGEGLEDSGRGRQRDGVGGGWGVRPASAGPVMSQRPDTVGTGEPTARTKAAARGRSGAAEGGPSSCEEEEEEDEEEEEGEGEVGSAVRGRVVGRLQRSEAAGGEEEEEGNVARALAASQRAEALHPLMTRVAQPPGSGGPRQPEGALSRDEEGGNEEEEEEQEGEEDDGDEEQGGKEQQAAAAARGPGPRPTTMLDEPPTEQQRAARAVRARDAGVLLELLGAEALQQCLRQLEQEEQGATATTAPPLPPAGVPLSGGLAAGAAPLLAAQGGEGAGVLAAGGAPSRGAGARPSLARTPREAYRQQFAAKVAADAHAKMRRREAEWWQHADDQRPNPNPNPSPTPTPQEHSTSPAPTAASTPAALEPPAAGNSHAAAATPTLAEPKPRVAAATRPGTQLSIADLYAPPRSGGAGPAPPGHPAGSLREAPAQQLRQAFALPATAASHRLLRGDTVAVAPPGAAGRGTEAAAAAQGALGGAPPRAQREAGAGEAAGALPAAPPAGREGGRKLPAGVPSQDDWQAWERRRRWLLDRESVLLLELEQCDHTLAFGATEQERLAALFLGGQLREEMAGVARAARQARRALQARKHRMRDQRNGAGTPHQPPPEPDATWLLNPDQGLEATGGVGGGSGDSDAAGFMKRVLGRLQPGETAIPPPPGRKALHGPALPWTAAGAEATLRRLWKSELMPEARPWLTKTAPGCFGARHTWVLHPNRLQPPTAQPPQLTSPWRPRPATGDEEGAVGEQGSASTSSSPPPPWLKPSSHFVKVDREGRIVSTVARAAEGAAATARRGHSRGGEGGREQRGKDGAAAAAGAGAGGEHGGDRVWVTGAEVPLLEAWHERLHGSRPRTRPRSAAASAALSAAGLPRDDPPPAAGDGGPGGGAGGPLGALAGSRFGPPVSRTQLFTLQAVLHEYRQAQQHDAQQREVLPRGVVAEQRHLAHEAAARQPELLCVLCPPWAALGRDAAPGAEAHPSAAAGQAGGAGGAAPAAERAGAGDAGERARRADEEPPGSWGRVGTQGEEEGVRVSGGAYQHAERLWLAGLPPLTGLGSRRLAGLVRRMAATPTHGATADAALQPDQVPWKPWPRHVARAHRAAEPRDEPGFRAAGEWGGGVDIDREMAKVRALPVDDWRSQLRKRDEWAAAVREARESLNLVVAAAEEGQRGGGGSAAS